VSEVNKYSLNALKSQQLISKFSLHYNGIYPATEDALRITKTVPVSQSKNKEKVCLHMLRIEQLSVYYSYYIPILWCWTKMVYYFI